MAPGIRKFALAAHLTFSLGWLGAVAGFLALAIAGLTSTDEQMVSAAYLSMNLIGWWVIVPFCVASLLSGLVQGLITPWGLFQHYWVVLKHAMTVILTILLVAHLQPARRLASAAEQGPISGEELHILQVKLAVDAGAALVALLVVLTLAVYKPQGRLRSSPRPKWVIPFVIALVAGLIAAKLLSRAGHYF